MNFRRLSMMLLTILSLHISAVYADDETWVSSAERNITELRQAIPLYEAAVEHPWPTLPEDSQLRPGVKSKYVLWLRERLKASGELKQENDNGTKIYDAELTEAVKQFQLAHGLEQTGAIGRKTLAALNISPDVRLHQLQVNLDRWMKLAPELSDRYILVNIPDYRLQVIENGSTILSMKAVVGKPERPTPQLLSTVRRVVFNPYWNVPKSIAQKDIVPKVIRNPDYLAEMHIDILDNQADDAIIIRPDEVDWQSALEDGFPYHFRQEPGPDNSLGLVKFEFENEFGVYLHDTPAKNLFDQDKRDFSSGCVRLEKPFELANYLMEDDPRWDEEHLQDIIESGKTSYLKASRPTRILIVYLTAWVDEYGNIQFRDDIYDEDQSVVS